jgi:clan AA aspartic protease
MGHIYASIELVNANDKELTKRGLIDKDEIRRMRVLALVDTGSIYMTINDNIQQVLQLPVVGRERSVLANGYAVECDKVFPLEVQFENRTAYCSALVLPNDSEPLLGAIPMEEMDVLIDPKRQELIINPAHPHYAITSLKTIPKTYPAT